MIDPTGDRPPRETSSHTTVKVLYVVGYGRSGSTILGNILGELHDVVHVGELRSLWRLGLLGRRLCGCGVPIRSCEFWSTVLKAGFDDANDGVDAVDAHRLQRAAVRLRSTRPILRLHGEADRGSPELRAYATIAGRLYQGIAEASGAHLIVDTSKHVADGALLTMIDGIDPYFVHLVRDPRAVAYSWTRSLRSPGEGKSEEMPRHGPFTSGRSWLVTNLAAESVRRAVGSRRWMTIRYEDFATDPTTTCRRVLETIGEPPDGLPFVDAHSVRLGPNHTAGGNPVRLTEGLTRIRLDDEWKRRQPVGARVVTSAVTLPLLRRYGYPAAIERSR